MVESPYDAYAFPEAQTAGSIAGTPPAGLAGRRPFTTTIGGGGDEGGGGGGFGGGGNGGGPLGVPSMSAMS